MKKLLFLIKTVGKTPEEIAREVMEALVAQGILVTEKEEGNGFDKKVKRCQN